MFSGLVRIVRGIDVVEASFYTIMGSAMIGLLVVMVLASIGIIPTFDWEGTVIAKESRTYTIVKPVGVVMIGPLFAPVSKEVKKKGLFVTFQTKANKRGKTMTHSVLLPSKVYNCLKIGSYYKIPSEYRYQDIQPD